MRGFGGHWSARGGACLRVAALLVLLLGASGVAAGGLVIEAGDKKQTFERYLEDYERCKARQEFTPERGEYETREEYRRRVEKLRVGCDTFRRYDNAVIRAPVDLDYDADYQRFEFELPDDRRLRINYRRLVVDDFPAFLKELPREQWHIDAPTPRASAYKECTLKTVNPNPKYFSKVEPYRADSWRGCMTYYLPDIEGAGWRREDGTFLINDVTFYAYIPVTEARRLKRDEAKLEFVLTGDMDVPQREFRVRQVILRNHRTDEVLLRIASTASS